VDTRRASRWKLDELAERAGVSARTVRYYVQRGLVPAPEFRGPDTAYTDEHLARLKAIRALQERHLPLDAIEAALRGRSPAAVARIAEGELPADLLGTARPPEPEREEAPTRWRRTTLAPGLELHLDEDATEAVRALADALRREAAKHGARGKR
jgi:DNA-binding transcriptional MerR regulator